MISSPMRPLFPPSLESRLWGAHLVHFFFFPGGVRIDGREYERQFEASERPD